MLFTEIDGSTITVALSADDARWLALACQLAGAHCAASTPSPVRCPLPADDPATSRLYEALASAFEAASLAACFQQDAVIGEGPTLATVRRGDGA